MKGHSLMKNFSQQRLKLMLSLFFLALAIPTGVLIWQTWSQLKWEAFHQYRGLAEEMTSRIDKSLAAGISAAEARSFTDYTFLVVSGDPSANFVQRSPLSELPVAQDLPGVIGYFQVGTEGEFSTPLLPQESPEPASFGIDAAEYEQRLQLSRQIQAVLSDNRLVQNQPADFDDERFFSDGVVENQAQEKEEGSESRVRQMADQPARSNALAEPAAKRDSAYSQSVFDQLGAEEKSLDEKDEGGKVAGLELNAALEKKSEVTEKLREQGQSRDDLDTVSPGRSKRKEQSALPEAEALESSPSPGAPVANLNPAIGLRISTFESEIDPLEFSLLDSGHLVLFRKVWRDGERYIQGLLIDQDSFLEEVIGTQLQGTGLAAMSDLTVAYQGAPLYTVGASGYSDYLDQAGDFEGDLLYRSRLSAPLGSLELIFSINGLPPGPGAIVLAWVTLVLAIVFLLGFYTMYRLGLGQINLARQQQDFVSAVSHELKTPLTSIRMYSEMLREGWADAAKQQQYYEYIHDESERLTRLISNVLQLANITRNEPQFDSKPILLGDLMSLINAKISGQVKSAGFELVFDTDSAAGDMYVNLDEDCFAQIIINLIDNAIKFSRKADARRIEINSILRNGNSVVISVRDFGPGVPKDQLKKIFQLFYRSESELTRETVGTGIGLAIVHQLSQAMGGKVDVINRQPGAEFRVSFPAVPPQVNTGSQ